MCDSTDIGCFFLGRRKKENGRSVPDLTASPGRAPGPGPMLNNIQMQGMQQQPQQQQQQMQQQQQQQQHMQQQQHQQRGIGGGLGNTGGSTNSKEPILHGDFRKVSGISSEIFRQIEAVENDHDPSTAAALESVERRGEMIVRNLDARCIGGRQAVEAAQKLMAKCDIRHIVQLVEIVKRPGQTLGLYIREGNGADRTDGVFVSRIALDSAVYHSGCLRVGDEILAVNLVDVTHMSLDDVVIIMSIPRRLVLVIRQRRSSRTGSNSPGPTTLGRPEQKPPPVVVIKQQRNDLRNADDDLDIDLDRTMERHSLGGAQQRNTTGRPSRNERRTGDGREMVESRSRLGLGLNNYSPQSEQQMDMYYNSRPNPINEPASWGGYKAPAPPAQHHHQQAQHASQLHHQQQQQHHHPAHHQSSVITDQPTKSAHQFAPSNAYYQNAGTLESLAEKVHSFYPGGPGRRMSTGTGPSGGIGGGHIGGGLVGSQSHMRFPRSGSDQHLPRVEYSDFQSLGRQSLLRSSLKTATVTGGGTLGRYGRYDSAGNASMGMPSARASGNKFGPAAGLGGQSSTLSRRSRPTLDYSSDTEATIGSRSSYYYYQRSGAAAAAAAAAAAHISATQHQMGTLPRGSTAALGGGPEMAKFNSLPRDRPGARLGLRTRLGAGLMDSDSDAGALSAPEMASRRAVAAAVAGQGVGGRMTNSPSIFTSEEYRAWLRRAPSHSAIHDQIRSSRDVLNQQRAHRFSCSAENIHDALKNTENIYSSRTGAMVNTLDRHLAGSIGAARTLSAGPVRSLSTQHISGQMRSPSVRRMRQLLELNGGVTVGGPACASSGMSGHQSPAPTPSTTLPRPQRALDINPAEFAKYKLDKPVLDVGGVSGMLWIHLLAGRGLRSTPEIVPGQPQAGIGQQPPQQPIGQAAQGAGTVRDLYCVLECDRIHKARTVVRSGDLQFDWDESFELDLVSNKQLDVLVYSWDPQHRHKLCFRGAVSLSTVLRQSPLHCLALKVEPRGTIYLRLRHTDPITLYRRRGLPSLRTGFQQLFGADLDGVVGREAKMFPGQAPVPVVLRRCVEEIERRGLDIIGLYRLCGSATKKRLLRESFERNCRSVELSPDHVPDINVITGVLKDYLRELPEPLFTRCLFQMTVDALGVCMPDDPEGNAKLMLSILDCLPRANRATLVFLLDHLSLVVSASERNKMTAQALATVMGPPLMLHSANTTPNTEVDHAQPIAVLKYLLQIWPQPQVSQTSGRRGEPAGQRGSKASALPAGKFPLSGSTSTSSLLTMGAAASVASSPSIGRLHHSATATINPQPYQSAVAPSAALPRALQPAATQPHLSVASADSVVRALSPLPGTPSPGSSSNSTNSGSGSGTDTVKRGMSPAGSISGHSTITSATTAAPATSATSATSAYVLSARLKESGSTYSISNNHSAAPSTHSTATLDRHFHKSSASAATTSGGGGGVSSSISSSTLASANGYGASIAQRSVLFAADLTSSSSSSQSIREALLNKHTAAAGSTATTAPTTSGLSTANAIKQTLSPLSQHRQTAMLLNGSAESKLASGVAAAAAATSSSSSTTLGTYQFPSSTLKTTGLNHQNFNNHHQHHQQLQQQHPSSSSSSAASASPVSLRKTTAMSPARGGSGSSSSSNSSSTNLPPTNVARNMLYQSESSYSLKAGGSVVGGVGNGGGNGSGNSTGASTSNYYMPKQSGASASSPFGLLNGQPGSSNPMSIYGTLPKSLGGSGNGGNSSATSALSGTGTYVGLSGAGASATSTVGGSSVYDMMSSASGAGGLNGGRSSSAGQHNTSNGGYNTLGSYRVQYSSTNPFLPSFNPASNGPTTTTETNGDE